MRTRTFPAGAIIVRPKGLDNVEIGLYGADEFGRCNAIGYRGKKTNPDFRYRFRSLGERDSHIAEFVRDCQKLDETRKVWRDSRKAKESSAVNPLKAGDILYSSWGYDQTNIDFYQVLESKGQFVKIRKLMAEITESGPMAMSGNTKPWNPGCFYEDAPVLRRKVITYSGGTYVRVDDCASASPWDGVPKTCSWYA